MSNRNPRSSRSHRKRSNRRSQKLRKRFLLFLFIELFVIGVVMLTIYNHNNRRIAELQKELQAIHDRPTTAPVETIAPPSPAPTATARRPRPTATPVAPPTQVPWYSRHYQKADGSILGSMWELHNRNQDTIGWIEVEKVFALPVVYRNNTYYLDHDFNKDKNPGGTIFLDANTPLQSNTQMLVLHGHNMKDGSMFAHLPHWRSRSYLRQHPILHFSTLYQEETYVIFAAMEVSTDPKTSLFFDISGYPNFPSDKAFSAWLNKVKQLTIHSINFDVTRDDALITLSTCVGDGRFIVLARRLRNGETEAAAIKNLGL